MPNPTTANEEQTMTVTIPVEWWEKYVALQRAVEEQLNPEYTFSEVVHYTPSKHGLEVIASAWLAISKLTKNQQGKQHD